MTDDVETHLARELEPPPLPDVVDADELEPGVYRGSGGGLVVVSAVPAELIPLDLVDVVEENGAVMVCIGDEVMSAARDLNDATAIISQLAGVAVCLEPADAGDGVPRWRPYRRD